MEQLKIEEVTALKTLITVMEKFGVDDTIATTHAKSLYKKCKAELDKQIADKVSQVMKTFEDQ